MATEPPGPRQEASLPGGVVVVVVAAAAAVAVAVAAAAAVCCCLLLYQFWANPFLANPISDSLLLNGYIVLKE